MYKNYFKKNLFIAIFILSFLAFYNFSEYSFAQSETDLRNSITNTNQEIKKLEAEIAKYNNDIKSTQKEAGSLREAIRVLEARKSNLENQISLTNLKLGNTKIDIAKTEEKINYTNLKIKTVGDGMSENIRSKMKILDTQNVLMNYLASKNISSLYDQINKNESISNSLNSKTLELKSLNQTLSENKKEYENKYAELEELEGDLKDKKTNVLLSQKEKDQLLKTTRQKEDAYKKLVAERTKKKQDLEKELLDFESKLKTVVNVGNLPKQGSGVLQYPLRNVRITQYFGNTPFSTQNPQVYNGMGHNGIDFAAPVGTALFSAADGRVIGIGDSDVACRGVSYGRWVLIRHNNGLSTLYAHMSTFDVSEGQEVKSGQKIGSTGNTGYSTGPHLHFTVFASDAVRISGPGEYRSRVCGTELRIPVSPRNGYLNPLSYL